MLFVSIPRKVLREAWLLEWDPVRSMFRFLFFPNFSLDGLGEGNNNEVAVYKPPPFVMPFDHFADPSDVHDDFGGGTVTPVNLGGAYG